MVNRMSDLNRQGFMNIKNKKMTPPLYHEGVRIDKTGKGLYKLTYGASIKNFSGTLKEVKIFAEDMSKS